MADEIIERLEAALRLEGEDAAIRIRADYAPLGGPGVKVFPPTYMGPAYHREERWDEHGERREICVLDSYQSQANRIEQALKAEAERLGLPQLILETEAAGRTVRISNFDAPHRSRDAYFLDSELDGVRFDDSALGKSSALVEADSATVALEHFPLDLVLGVWDSHRGKRIATKFPRSYTSEIVAWDPISGTRAATKGDPLNLPGDSRVPQAAWRSAATSKGSKRGEVKLSELGHGMVPSEPVEGKGGVSVKRICRDAVLSFPSLARFDFPTERGDATAAGRVVLAALALAGDRLAFARAGLTLRSGCELVLVKEEAAWVGRGGVLEPLELDPESARALLSEARRRLAACGVEWNPAPIVVQPTRPLREMIEATFATAETGVEDAG
jgi:CRISPR-associated protein Csb1